MKNKVSETDLEEIMFEAIKENMIRHGRDIKLLECWHNEGVVAEIFGKVVSHYPALSFDERDARLYDPIQLRYELLEILLATEKDNSYVNRNVGLITYFSFLDTLSDCVFGVSKNIGVSKEDGQGMNLLKLQKIIALLQDKRRRKRKRMEDRGMNSQTEKATE